MYWLLVAGSLAVAPPQRPLVFPSQTELVHVVVSVTDKDGVPIRGLQAKDFAVSEDGRPRPVATFAACGDVGVTALTQCPVDLVLLWDTSHSMLDNLRRARAAAVHFVESVPAAHGRAVVAFDSHIRVADYDPANPHAAFDQTLSEGTGGATRFFDAVLEGIAHASPDSTRRVIMVALTDGEDSLPGNSSRDVEEREPVKEVARSLQNASVGFYAISFSKHLLRPEREKRARDTLQALAHATGGLVIDGEAPDMTWQFDAIRRDLASQYILGFVPGDATAGRTHSIRLKVSAKDAKVRHRPAYRTTARN